MLALLFATALGGPVEVAPPPRLKVPELLVRVIEDQDGNIAGVTVRAGGTTEDLGADLKKFRAWLAAQAKARPDMPVQIEVGRRLTYSHLVTLLDAAAEAGFRDISIRASKEP